MYIVWKVIYIYMYVVEGYLHIDVHVSEPASAGSI